MSLLSKRFERRLFHIFVRSKKVEKRIMETFLTAAMISAFSFMAARHITRNIKSVDAMDRINWLVPAVMICSAFALACNLATEGGKSCRMCCIVMSAVCSLLPYVSSLFTHRVCVRVLAFVILWQLSGCCMMLLSVAGIVRLPSDVDICHMTIALSCMLIIAFIVGVYFHLADIKTVMRFSSTWESICLSVDFVYLAIVFILTVLLQYGFVVVFNVLLSGLLVSLNVRIAGSSVFVLMTEHERKIVESMRITHVEVTGANVGMDRLYEGIYERVQRYFDKERPYLNNELTINDIVDVVFTNKLYISRAISHHTGRNFCQFVNYYRISYAVELFRNDPQLKIIEMASRSGFNSTTSFSAAFRLYIGDKPSEWCRKERARLMKTGKNG